MANIAKLGKCAMGLFSRGNAASSVTKYAPKQNKVLRLFSLKSDPAIGTEITNNMTGTRIFQRGALERRNVSVKGFTTINRADGSYTGIPNETFDKLLKMLKTDPKGWNPILQHDTKIGTELLQKGTNNRFFRSSNEIDKHLITKIQSDGRYSSMTLEQFDNMILNMLG